MLSVTALKIALMWKQSTYPSTEQINKLQYNHIVESTQPKKKKELIIGTYNNMDESQKHYEKIQSQMAINCTIPVIRDSYKGKTTYQKTGCQKLEVRVEVNYKEAA